MEYFNNILCVTKPELTEGEEPIMSVDAYDKYLLRIPEAQRDIIRVRKGGGINCPALLDYEKLRADIKQKIRLKYGNPYETTKHNQFEDKIEPDIKAKDYFDTYRKADGSLIKLERRINYYTNAIIFNAVQKIANNKAAFKKARGGKATGIFKELSALINELDTKRFPHTIPPNFRGFKTKYDQYVKYSYFSLIHKGEGNTNSLKIDDDKKTAMFRELFSDHRNLDDTQILMLYNMVAEPMGWDKITVGTVRNWREKLTVDIFAGRHGVTAHRNSIAMQVKRSAPTAPLYFWTMDGWDAELLFQKQTQNNKGQKVITYHNRPTVVVVLDPFTKYPVGYAIGTHETPELIKAALRNAVNHVRELFGLRYKPHQLQTDNYSLSALQYTYENVADKHTPARVKNAKAKVIEPYFRYINDKFCHLMPNWSGHGVTASKKNQPNDEFLNKIRHSFPDEQECYSQIDGIMKLERAAKHDEYVKGWANVADEDKLLLTDEMYLYLFGETTGYTNRLQGQGILATINGNDCAFDTFDAKMRNYGYEDWMLKYDPADLTQVLAINAKKIDNKPVEIGTLRFMLTQKYVQPMALKERKEGDAHALAEIKSFNKEMETAITERRALSGATVKELFENNPQLNNTLSKLVLVDSLGQHKNNRNATREVREKEAKPIATPVKELEDYGEIIDDPLEFIRNNF